MVSPLMVTHLAVTDSAESLINAVAGHCLQLSAPSRLYTRQVACHSAGGHPHKATRQLQACGAPDSTPDYPTR